MPAVEAMERGQPLLPALPDFHLPLDIDIQQILGEQLRSVLFASSDLERVREAEGGSPRRPCIEPGEHRQTTTSRAEHR